MDIAQLIILLLVLCIFIFCLLLVIYGSKYVKASKQIVDNVVKFSQNIANDPELIKKIDEFVKDDVWKQLYSKIQAIVRK